MIRIQLAKRPFSILLSSGIVALCTFFTVSSTAANDRYAALYGNTLITTDGGIVSHFWYKPDHTFTGLVPAYAYTLKGRWKENADGTICRHFNPPLPTVKNPDCGPMMVNKVGDSLANAEGHSEKLVLGVR